MTLRELLTRNPFTIAWIGWLIMFAFIEGTAIWSNVPRAMLSHHIRDWFSNRPTWVIVGAWVFFAWLAMHLLLGLRK